MEVLAWINRANNSPKSSCLYFFWNSLQYHRHLVNYTTKSQQILNSLWVWGFFFFRASNESYIESLNPVYNNIYTSATGRRCLLRIEQRMSASIITRVYFLSGHITSFFSMYSQDNSWFFSDLSGKIREHLPMINPPCVTNIIHPSTLFKYLYPFLSINKSWMKVDYEEINCSIIYNHTETSLLHRKHPVLS